MIMLRSLSLAALFFLAACSSDPGEGGPADAADVSETQDAAADTSSTPDATPSVDVETDEGAEGDTAADTSTAAHRVLGVDPSSGPLAGRNSVTVSGEGFDARCSVRFGASAALASNLVDATLLEVTVPPGDAGGAVDVTVRCRSTDASLSDAYTYEDSLAPTVTSVEPDFGRVEGGESVTLRGTNLREGARNFVAFGDAFATELAFTEDAESMTVTTPENLPGVVSVTVELGDRRAADVPSFRFVEAVTLDEVVPGEGALGGGEEVELRGRGLHAFAEPVVRFGGLDADVVDSDEDGRRLRVLTPAGEAPGEVAVSCATLGGEADLSAGFAYVEEGSGEGSGEGSAEGSGG